MTEAELSAAMAQSAKATMHAFKMAEMVDGAQPKGLKGRERGRRGPSPSIEDYKACAAKGMSIIETARHFGVTRFAVDYAVREHGVKFADGRSIRPRKSGFPGVSWHERDQKWQVRAYVRGKQFFVGLFEDVNVAAKARENFLKEKGVRE